MSHAEETEAYAAYFNASLGRPFEDAYEQKFFEQDCVKAKTAMEVAWLKEHPEHSLEDFKP